MISTAAGSPVVDHVPIDGSPRFSFSLTGLESILITFCRFGANGAYAVRELRFF
jgi:hypothetical protein